MKEEVLEKNSNLEEINLKDFLNSTSTTIDHLNSEEENDESVNSDNEWADENIEEGDYEEKGKEESESDSSSSSMSIDMSDDIEECCNLYNFEHQDPDYTGLSQLKDEDTRLYYSSQPQDRTQFNQGNLIYLCSSKKGIPLMIIGPDCKLYFF